MLYDASTIDGISSLLLEIEANLSGLPQNEFDEIGSVDYPANLGVEDFSVLHLELLRL